MSYKALYRVFRPRTFDEVVGQKHIVSVLKGQVVSGQISHAYLFTGSRGTGKTSLAKIFARSISCPNSKDGEACLSCQLCKDTFNDTSIDVVEIDAASNNGVDEIRELRENVKYAPIMGRYKVYIIDEVHMLSTAAFNALLKTLEEPPSYIVFILATTEPQKLPETITSRCQRYDFERISNEDIADRLAYICNQIGAKADREALLLIGEYSKGGLRDAISLLDQCIAFGDGHIDKNSVLSLLGKSNEDVLLAITDMLIGGDGVGAVAYMNELLKGGQNPTVFAGDIIEHFRNLMLLQASPSLVNSINSGEKYVEQSKKADIHMILRGIKILSAAIADMKYSFLPVVILEVALIEICTPTADKDNLALMQRLAELERLVKNIKTNNTVIVKEEVSKKDNKAQGESSSYDDVPWDDAFMGMDAPPELEEGTFIMDEEEDMPAEADDNSRDISVETMKDSIDNNEDGDEENSAPMDCVDFTKKDYDRLLNTMNKVNKALHMSLRRGFFGGFSNGTLTIGFPDDSYDVFISALDRKKDEIVKTLNDMGFKDLKVCVKILEQDKTEDLKEMFGNDITFVD